MRKFFVGAVAAAVMFVGAACAPQECVPENGCGNPAKIADHKKEN